MKGKLFELINGKAFYDSNYSTDILSDKDIIKIIEEAMNDFPTKKQIHDRYNNILCQGVGKFFNELALQNLKRHLENEMIMEWYVKWFGTK